jgi:hypothetical protein
MSSDALESSATSSRVRWIAGVWGDRIAKARDSADCVVVDDVPQHRLVACCEAAGAAAAPPMATEADRRKRPRRRLSRHSQKGPAHDHPRRAGLPTLVDRGVLTVWPM